MDTWAGAPGMEGVANRIAVLTAERSGSTVSLCAGAV